MDRSYILTQAEIENLKKRAASEATALLPKWQEEDQEFGTMATNSTEVVVQPKSSKTTQDRDQGVERRVAFDPNQEIHDQLSKWADRVRDLEANQDEVLDLQSRNLVLGLVLLNSVVLFVVPFAQGNFFNHWGGLLYLIGAGLLTLTTASAILILLLRASSN